MLKSAFHLSEAFALVLFGLGECELRLVSPRFLYHPLTFSFFASLRLASCHFGSRRFVSLQSVVLCSPSLIPCFVLHRFTPLFCRLLWLDSLGLAWFPLPSLHFVSLLRRSFLVSLLSFASPCLALPSFRVMCFCVLSCASLHVALRQLVALRLSLPGLVWLGFVASLRFPLGVALLCCTSLRLSSLRGSLPLAAFSTPWTSCCDPWFD